MGGFDPFALFSWTGCDVQALLSPACPAAPQHCLFIANLTFLAVFRHFPSHILWKNHLESGCGAGFCHVPSPGRVMTVLRLFIYKKIQTSVNALEKCVRASAAEGCVEIHGYEMSIIIRKD